MNFVNEFHQHGRIQRGGNPRFITLIPKKQESSNIKDCRPISLIGCMYKILAKLLANRLAKVGLVVSNNQRALVGDKQIFDSILVLNNFFDFMKKEKKGFDIQGGLGEDI